MPENLWPEATAWATETFDTVHGSWGIFFRLEDAQAAWSRFLRDVPGIRLFGFGLHTSLVPNYLDETAPAEQQPGYAPNGAYGQWQALRLGLTMPPGGQFLGFEPVVTYHGLMTCSWFCNGLHHDLEKTYGTKSNAYGLIPDFDIALKLSQDAESIGAKPGLWQPWAIYEYDNPK